MENQQRNAGIPKIQDYRENVENITPRERDRRARASRSPDFTPCECIHSPAFNSLPKADRRDLSLHLRELAIQESNSNPEIVAASSQTSAGNYTSDAETIAAIDELLGEYS